MPRRVVVHREGRRTAAILALLIVLGAGVVLPCLGPIAGPQGSVGPPPVREVPLGITPACQPTELTYFSVTPASVDVAPYGVQVFTATSESGCGTSLTPESTFSWWLSSSSLGMLNSSGGPTVAYFACVEPMQGVLHARATAGGRSLYSNITISVTPAVFAEGPSGGGAGGEGASVVPGNLVAGFGIMASFVALAALVLYFGRIRGRRVRTDPAPTDRFHRSPDNEGSAGARTSPPVAPSTAGPEIAVSRRGSRIYALVSLPRTRAIVRSRRGKGVVSSIAILYAVLALWAGYMLQLGSTGASGMTLEILTGPRSPAWWNYPALLVIAPGAVLVLPLFTTALMVLASLLFGLGMGAGLLLAVRFVRSWRAARTSGAVTSSLAGLTPAMVALLTVGACCSTSAAAAGSIGAIASASGPAFGPLLSSSWFLGVLQVVVLLLALLAQEQLLAVYGRILATSREQAPSADHPGLSAPRLRPDVRT